MSEGSGNQQRQPAHSEDHYPRIYAPGVRLVQRQRFELDLEKSITPADVETWLLGEASKTASAHALVAEFAGQLAQSGFGVDRFTVVAGTLHPQIRRLDRGQCDGHDFGGQDEIRFDRTFDFLLL